ncbi:MAG TPA: resolvase [Clostridiales bacterium]|nr:MAG: hypothetical protein A2Y22_05955 [Clostridiales bacterium GWD2_32_59]HAN09594.1 resolvase [Clostridiales bacterium]
MRCAYVRISSTSQNEDRQMVMMREQGIDERYIYVEKESGKNITDRPVLQDLMSFLRPDDVLVVESISRLSRSTKDFLYLLEKLESMKVKFVSLKENIDTSNEVGRAIVTIIAAFAQLEREQLKRRQAEGIAIAKEKGVYKGRNKIIPDKRAFEKVYQQWKVDKSITAKDAMKILGLSPNTFYRRVKEFEDSQTIYFNN